MATDTPATLAAVADVAGISGVSSQNFSALGEDFSRLHGPALQAALGDLAVHAAQALGVAQSALSERAAERQRVLDAFKTDAVRRQLDAAPALKVQADLLLKAEATAAEEDKKTGEALALLGRLASAGLPRK